MLSEPAEEERFQVHAEATVLGLVGSPNRDGRTFQMVSAGLQGAARAGARVELVQLADHRVAACRDCVPSACADTQKCAYSDAGLEYLSEKLWSCGALILGTPIYWWDTLFAEAQARAAAGEDLESLKLTTSLYEAGAKAFEAQG
jgi:hypothetical protein